MQACFCQLSKFAKKRGVSIEVKVAAGFPVRQVIFQEIAYYNADWIILDRIKCKVALARDDFTVEAWISHHSREADATDHKPVCSLSHVVSLSDGHNFEDPQHSIPHDISDLLESHAKHSNASRSRENISSSDFGSSSNQEKSVISPKGESKQNKYGFLPKSSDAPILCAGCGTRTELCTKESKRFCYSDIQKATNNFSNDNLLGEGRYGHVYKGVLRAHVVRWKSALGIGNGIKFHD